MLTINVLVSGRDGVCTPPLLPSASPRTCDLHVKCWTVFVFIYFILVRVTIITNHDSVAQG